MTLPTVRTEPVFFLQFPYVVDGFTEVVVVELSRWAWGAADEIVEGETARSPRRRPCRSPRSFLHTSSSVDSSRLRTGHEEPLRVLIGWRSGCSASPRSRKSPLPWPPAAACGSKRRAIDSRRRRGGIHPGIEGPSGTSRRVLPTREVGRSPRPHASDPTVATLNGNGQLCQPGNPSWSRPRQAGR